ncbi:acetyltransferase [Exophiala aquamarina CBS 119918]|uniref:Acetyltransferase n=1 Tax=Exophiala aquamarina CBS 119918 TaxID=1182545 RepID=A0A072PIM3_9EURO|nr:acetyltransferase [Exophiala aquamarina CBS 119918]KEF59168.1 acetyltransferase [Exophiala aquamarina CBS 119918]
MAEVSTPTYRIRYATAGDVPSILALINELADYEHALDSVHATVESLTNTLSFPDANSPTGFTPGYAKTLLLTLGSTASSEDVAGMALFFHNYSTWNAAPGIYLEDLFVRPAHRGAGFGTALIQALARECVRLGCQRLEWAVLKWNEPSIKFYQGPSVGATRMEEWVGMRVDGERLGALAAGKGV